MDSAMYHEYQHLSERGLLVALLSICFISGCQSSPVVKENPQSSEQTPSDTPPNAVGGNHDSNQQPDLLLITIDTLRADRLPLYGYQKISTPHLDALAEQSVVFAKAAAHTPITLPSHACILTGLYPPQHGVRNNGSFYARPELNTMAEMLKVHGYRTAAFISAFVLDSRFGLDQGFEHYDDDLVDGRRRFSKFGVKDRRAENTVSRVLAWLDRTEMKKQASPIFIWAHLYDPHFAYEPPEPFRSRYSHPYDGEIAYTDQQIGRLLDGLKKSGRFDDTLIVVTGDHGESLGEHGESTHSLFVYEATQWVPLIIKLPAGLYGGRRFEGLVRHIDILPTIVHALSVEKRPGDLTESLPGTSLLSRMEGTEIAPVPESYAEAYLPKDQFGWSALFAWRDDRHKYIEAPTSELYDLVGDPTEQRNLISVKPPRASSYREKLRALQARLAPVSGVDLARNEMDEETKAKLKALGYLSGSEPSSMEQGKDPKEMVHLYEAREAAHRHMEQGAYEKAILILRRVLEEDPTNPSTHNDLASVFAELERWKEAEKEYRRARDLAPKRSDFYRGLAKVYFKGLRDFKAAKREIDAAFALASHNPSLWTLKGDFLHAQGKMAEAAQHYRQAVEKGEQNASLFTGYASALTNLGQLDEARKMAEEALRIDNENVIAHYNLGVILEGLGTPEKAEAAYRTAIRLQPQANVLAHENLGDLLLEQGRNDEAKEVLEAAVGLDSNAPGALYHLGSLHLKEGNFDEAVSLLEKAVRLSPSSAPNRTNLGYAYERLGRHEQALEQYRSLTKIYPKNKLGHADAWLRMARMCARQGRRGEAIRYLETARSLGGPPIVKAATADPDLADLIR